MNNVVSQTFLAHAVLAHLSPEVATLDRILALRSQGALRTVDEHSKPTLASIPPELLLHVRSYLMPSVTDALMAETTTAYADTLLARARSLCSECLAYNVYVYGADSLTWPESREGLDGGAQGCDCGVTSVRSDLFVGSLTSTLATSPINPHEQHARRGHKRAPSCSAKPISWLEQHLSQRAGSEASIRKVVDNVLASEFGVALAESGTSFPSAPSSQKADVSELVSFKPSEDFRLAKVARELVFSGASPTAGSDVLSSARRIATEFITETIADMPQPHEVATARVEVREPGPSVGTLFGAGFVLAAYAVARLTAII